MKKLFLWLMFLQFAVIRPSQAYAGQVEGFFRDQFKYTDVIYIGEFHTVTEHKDVLAGLLQELMMDGTVDGFAFEFTKASDQQAFEQYLRDTDATPGSEKEFEHFKHLNRSYSNMFNVKEYDAIMRLMKRIWTAKQGKVTLCAIDARSVNKDESNNGPKYQTLKALPQVVQDEIVKVAGKSIEEIAKDWPAFDREASMGVSIANCAARAKKTIAYVGMGHAIRTERIMPTDWRTAARYTEVALPNKKVKSALFAQGYFDPYDPQTMQIPMFSKECLSVSVPGAVAHASNLIPSQFDPCVTATSPDGAQKVSYATAFDMVVFGPKGSKIKPTPERQWR